MFVVRVFGRELLAFGFADGGGTDCTGDGPVDLGIEAVASASWSGEDFTPPARVGF